MSEVIDTVAKCVGYGFAGYFSLLTIGSLVQTFGSKKIRSSKDLERVAKDVAEELDLDTHNLVTLFYEKGHPKHDEIRRSGSRSRLSGLDTRKRKLMPYGDVDGERVVELQVLETAEGWGAREGMVRHAAYHLKHHLPRSSNSLVRQLKWGYQEPAAVLYAISGIKI
jgi:hypothetical protein